MRRKRLNFTLEEWKIRARNCRCEIGEDRELKYKHSERSQNTQIHAISYVYESQGLTGASRNVHLHNILKSMLLSFRLHITSRSADVSRLRAGNAFGGGKYLRKRTGERQTRRGNFSNCNSDLFLKLCFRLSFLNSILKLVSLKNNYEQDVLEDSESDKF
jgi:hypothetical protein